MVGRKDAGAEPELAELKDAPSSAAGQRRFGATLQISSDRAFIDGGGMPHAGDLSRGGLSAWQQRAVTDFVEVHLGDVLRLHDMARLARLSPFHFARAFKQSFGVPPHRYHVGRRIARAKHLLADPAKSITGIARELGFAETSSFSSTFRRVTGASPSIFRRDCT